MPCGRCTLSPLLLGADLDAAAAAAIGRTAQRVRSDWLLPDVPPTRRPCTRRRCANKRTEWGASRVQWPLTHSLPLPSSTANLTALRALSLWRLPPTGPSRAALSRHTPRQHGDRLALRPTIRVRDDGGGMALADLRLVAQRRSQRPATSEWPAASGGRSLSGGTSGRQINAKPQVQRMLVESAAPAAAAPQPLRHSDNSPPPVAAAAADSAERAAVGGGAEIDADDCREAVQRLRRERPMEASRPPPV